MQAYKIMHGLWGMGQMMFTKNIVVVDDDVDVHNTSEVLFRLCPPQLSTMNHQPATGIDATIPPCGTPTNPESFRGWPPLIKMDEAVKAKVEQLLRGSQRPRAR